MSETDEAKGPDYYRDLFLERDAFLKSFEERRQKFDSLMNDQARRRKEFEDALSEEISESRAALAEVAPIAQVEIADIPMHRAAYTDRMAAVMAKLSLLAYVQFEDDEHRIVLEKAVEAAGLKLLAYWEVGDTEAYLVEAPNFLAVAFRGTTDRGDRKIDFRIGVQRVQVAGHVMHVTVHDGFYDAFRLVEPGLRIALNATAPSKPIFLTGHSLGGAVALVASAALSGVDSLGGRIAAVYTFGAPRVGGANFARVIKAPHYRVVNEGDVVPLVPPNWISGYQHNGELLLLRRGAIHPVRTRPWLSTLVLALRGLILWPFSKSLLFLRRHAISLYASRLDVIAKERGNWS